MDGKPAGLSTVMLRELCTIYYRHISSRTKCLPS
jgi:hypothetical protein